MKRRSLIPRLIAVPLLTAALHGCQSGDRRQPATELAVLHGISAVEVDGGLVHLKRAADAGNVSLLVGGQAIDEATLHPGGRFALADGGYVTEMYQVLLAGEKRITLRRERFFGCQTTSSGIETVDTRSAADLVTLTPYDLEETRPRGDRGARASGP